MGVKGEGMKGRSLPKAAPRRVSLNTKTYHESSAIPNHSRDSQITESVCANVAIRTPLAHA